MCVCGSGRLREEFGSTLSCTPGVHVHVRGPHAGFGRGPPFQLHPSTKRKWSQLHHYTQTHELLSSVCVRSRGSDPAERFQCHLLSSKCHCGKPAGLQILFYFHVVKYRAATVPIAGTCVLSHNPAPALLLPPPPTPPSFPFFIS